MKKYKLSVLNNSEKRELLIRSTIFSDEKNRTVKNILFNIKEDGEKAAVRFAKKFDGFNADSIYVTEKEFTEAGSLLPAKIKSAIKTAYENIYNFHEKQYPQNYSVETYSGIKCERRFIPINNVGVYIPAGTAPLPSTMLMLGIPAQIAGCKRIVAASPVKRSVHPAILFAAKLCGVNEFIKVGGAQGIALMAYGSSDFKRVDKIFGPGNQYVTLAKGLVSIDPEGCAIDMLAGPSELLIIADDRAKPDYVAADLLSQAEHGPDSIVVLVTTSEDLFRQVKISISKQIIKLPRKEAVKASLSNSFCLVVSNLDDAVKFSNEFAPEHLMLNVKNPAKYADKVINAGSVFIGEYTPESAGDYASGTNHSLPTYGFARSSGGVSVEMFMKGITFQAITKKGIKKIADTIIDLAETESLQAHAESVKVRLK
jgi:histidinol dehydrogenase